MIDKDEIEKLVEKKVNEKVNEKVEEKISNIKQVKSEEERRNYITVVLFNFIITFIYYICIRTSKINEKFSIHNIPSFPLYQLTLNVNFDLIKGGIDISCYSFLYFKNGSTIKAKYEWFPSEDKKYYYTQPLIFLGNYPTLNEEDYLCVVVFCHESDHKKLSGKIFTLNYSTFIINSNDHIEEKKNQKIYILDEELILKSKIDEGKVYKYKIESNTIKKGDLLINYSSISECEKIRFIPKDIYGDTLFILLFEKGDILKIAEIEETTFLGIYFKYFGTIGIFVNILLFCYKRK